MKASTPPVPPKQTLHFSYIAIEIEMSNVFHFHPLQVILNMTGIVNQCMGATTLTLTPAHRWLKTCHTNNTMDDQNNLPLRCH